MDELRSGDVPPSRGSLVPLRRVGVMVLGLPSHPPVMCLGAVQGARGCGTIRAMEIIIPDPHVESTCRPGTETCCSYLAMSGDGWLCLKGDSKLHASIDARRAAGTMKAMGDNCPGIALVIIPTVGEA